MKTPNERMQELAEEIFKETGERIECASFDWATQVDGSSYLIKSNTETSRNKK